MQQARNSTIHSVIIPTASVSLLVPSATIAEVINVSRITPVSHSPEWCLGAVGWRHQAVSVISFENLQGEAIQQPTLRSKVVIFYPLRGCEEWDFFAVLSSAEPQPYTVDESIVEAEAGDTPDSRYISTAIKVEEKVVAIPDLDALRVALFPK